MLIDALIKRGTHPLKDEVVWLKNNYKNTSTD